MLKISLSGPAGCGKDTIAAAMQETYNLKPLAFAAPMKYMVAYATGLTMDQVDQVKEGKLRPEKAAGMRRILQMIGTDVFRNHWSEGIWIDHMLRRVDEVEKGKVVAQYGSVFDGRPYHGVVTTDTRFSNEFRALAAEGFVMVDVLCPEEHYRCPPGSDRYNHPSERDLDTLREAGAFHVAVMNDRSKTPEEMAVLVYDLCRAHFLNIAEV